MVYLLKKVIFHGYVSHNQMVTPITHPFIDGLPMKMVIFHGYVSQNQMVNCFFLNHVIRLGILHCHGGSLGRLQGIDG